MAALGGPGRPIDKESGNCSYLTHWHRSLAGGAARFGENGPAKVADSGEL